MRAAVAEIEDPINAMFFKAHLSGMEKLVEVTRQWYDEPTPELHDRIQTLRQNLTEGLQALRNSNEPASAHIAN
jgi:hypothetical protein